ncbi:glutamyl-tRNA synthetase [Capsaspora owczarzaki ATCC 30864]|uniref:glutamyl-tRNA synthetase n=1 Tax=Capsaspora owczarzaki (strain ATCC 30864) TaxID=595528 RepID=UPI0001FE3380|nr:glutamyl-tRNA synthetase [Capsaspora owczarzaki ATCC 30864]|eukprot:XP_004347282.1 glutamyl-tRNA synthetase [Capsaspora owczarzaki ATCC 30864]
MLLGLRLRTSLSHARPTRVAAAAAAAAAAVCAPTTTGRSHPILRFSLHARSASSDASQGHSTASPVRVRFAPSPTGFLHLGGLRTALYNHLFAKKAGGTTVLRIEDTDQTREVKGAALSIENILRWTGIEFDESPTRGGNYGPYHQSQRLPIYHSHVKKLLETDSAYQCFCSAERLDIMRLTQQKTGLPVKYDKHCLTSMTREERQRRADAKETHVVRLNVPTSGATVVDDMVYGSVSYPNAVIDDQVLLKSDGFPTYHLANVVDDHLMDISHVMRGEEWLSSTPKHIILYNRFGWRAPKFAHLPLLLNKDRTKLSKRQGDVFVEQFRDAGFTAQALVSFVALLGWGPEHVHDKMTMEQLIPAFDISRVHRGGAIVDTVKLRSLSKAFLIEWPAEFERLTPAQREGLDALRAAISTQVSSNGANQIPADRLTDAYLHAVVFTMKDRVSLVPEIASYASYFWVDAAPDTQASSGPFGALLHAVRRAFAENLSAAEFTEDRIIATIKAQLPREDQLNGALKALRMAVTGAKSGAPLGKTLQVLGHSRTLSMLDNSLAVAPQPSLH